MRDSDTAYGLLKDLERSLQDTRSRLADLVELSRAREGVVRTGLEHVLEVPVPDYAPEVPAELSLPAEVEAPQVVVLPDVPQGDGARPMADAGLSAR